MTEENKGLYWLNDVEDKEEDINSSVLVLVTGAPIIYSWRLLLVEDNDDVTSCPPIAYIATITTEPRLYTLYWQKAAPVLCAIYINKIIIGREKK